MWNIRLKLSICATVLFATISCGSLGANRGKKGNSNSEENPQNAAITIIVGKSESREVASTIKATGSLIADETSDIAPKTAGKISNVMVNVGQYVSQGSVVAKIDDRDARNQLATANASVKQTTAAVRQAEARLGLSPNGNFNS